MLHSMPIVWATCALVLVGCDARRMATSTTGLTFGDCDGAPVTLVGDPAFPRSLAIDNGLVRVTYPQLVSGSDQLGAHMLELNIVGQWKPVLTSWYGDWTFFGAPFFEPAHTAHVLTETPDVVEVAFEFDHWLDHPGGSSTLGHVPRWWDEISQGPCNASPSCRCYLEGCGVAALDFEGGAIFPHNYLDVPKFIRRVTFTKVIRVDRCGSGYFVGYHSNPTLTWGSWVEWDPHQSAAGEREHGLGWMASVTFASSGVIVRNPEAGAHRSLDIVEQVMGPWWFASIPPAATDVEYALFLAEEHPLPSFVWQFDPAHPGTPLVHKMNPEVELDGRVGRYQTFLGAFPYVMTDRDIEPSPEVRAAVLARLPTVWP